MSYTCVTIYDDTEVNPVCGRCLAFERRTYETADCHPMDFIGKESGPVDSLDDLYYALRGAELSDESQYPLHDLPIFGGFEPDDTAGVLSWDAGRLLIGEGQVLNIIPR